MDRLDLCFFCGRASSGFLLFSRRTDKYEQEVGERDGENQARDAEQARYRSNETKSYEVSTINGGGHYGTALVPFLNCQKTVKSATFGWFLGVKKHIKTTRDIKISGHMNQS